MSERGTWRILGLIASVMLLAGCSESELPGDLPPLLRDVDLPEVSFELPAAGPHATRPYNILLISIDTLRADRLSAYGFSRPTSPRIDALAKEGVLFEHAYSHSPKTAESHMSIMTSLYPEVHRVQNFVKDTTPLSESVPTLATILDGAGYRTEAYTGGGNVTAPLGFARGFDHFGEFTVYDPGGAAVERATTALRELARDRGEDAPPFFFFVHTFKVHGPYAPPERYLEGFVEPGFEDQIPGTHERLTAVFDAGDKPADAFWGSVDKHDPGHVRHIDELYQAEIRYTDDRLRALLAALDETGLGRDTLVVLLSDHGEEFMDHGHIRHERLYQELLHVPLIVRYPASDPDAAEPGTRIDAVVRMIDVMPTILEYVGIQPPAHIQGKSFQQLTTGAEEAPRFVWSQWYQSGESALRIGDWKLYDRVRVEPLVRVGKYSFFWDTRYWDELYELGSDPHEQVDLSDAYGGTGEEIRHTLDELRAQRDVLRAHFGTGEEVQLDEDTKRQLEALGYL